MDPYVKSFLLMFVLLNPFTMSVYLLSLVRTLSAGELLRQLSRAATISLGLFLLFAVFGDRIFEDFLQVRFASFLAFGGITFLIIGIRLILGAGPAIEATQPESGQTSASIAMPYIVGPGTISASVLAGARLGPAGASLTITAALVAAVTMIVIFKLVHDAVRSRNARLLDRYSAIAGRITALFTGTFAIEMLFTAAETWIAGFAR